MFSVLIGRSYLRAIFWFAVIVGLFSLDENRQPAAQAQTNVTQWSINDLEFTSSTTHAWNNFPLQATFTHQASGTTLSVDGYWAGGNTWRIRFAPTLAGTWIWQTNSSDSGLNGHTGSYQVTAPSAQEVAANPNYQGHVKVSPGNRYLSYADNQPFLWIGDTGWNINAIRAGLQAGTLGQPFFEYVNDRKNKKFTVIQTQFFQIDDPNEGGYPFPNNINDTGDFSILSDSHFAQLDTRIQAIWDSGLVIAAHPTWFSKAATLNVTVDDAEEISRYLLARYGAYNLVWSLSGEYQYSFDDKGLTWSVADWQQLGNFVQSHNAYDHPVTVHSSGSQSWNNVVPNSGNQSSSGLFHNEAWLDLNWQQTGHQEKFLENIPFRLAQDYEKTPVKPVIHTESFYENHNRHGNPPTLAQLRWKIWITFLNGGAGHTYGAVGVWPFYNPDVDPGPPLSWNSLTWHDGITSPGSQDIQYVYNFLSTISWWELAPHRDWLSINGNLPQYDYEDNKQDPHLAANADVSNVVVFIPEDNETNTISINSLNNYGYDAQWFNPRDGTFSTANISNPVTPTNSTWTLPNRPAPANEDWVLHLTKVGGSGVFPTNTPTIIPSSTVTPTATNTPTETPTSVPTATNTPDLTPVIFEARVIHSRDDAEEFVSNGRTLTGNNDLELVRDGSNDQIIGIRFQNVIIPQNANIINAYLEFETDETDSEATNLVIRGQASDTTDRFTFCTLGCFDISARPDTQATVAWNNLPPWDAVNEKHQTPNLNTIVQEIINRPGWASGNHMAFFISGSGKRVAESFNGEADAAPLLHVEYTLGPLPTPTNTPSPTFTATATPVPLPTETPTVGPSPTPTNTPLPTFTPTAGPTATNTPVSPPSTFQARVIHSRDDGEERASNGRVITGNADLELIRDGSHDQVVGIRFQDITVPMGATILNSTITFETDETSTELTSLTFHGEDADNPTRFTGCTSGGCFDISGRPHTTASVNWNNIPAWNTVDETHQSPNLAPIVQELVNRSGWVPGNSMVFIISGSGKRVAESFNGEADAAPLLHIEYTLGPLPTPTNTPPPTFTATATPVPPPTETPTVGPSPTPTNTPLPTFTPTATATADASAMTLEIRVNGSKDDAEEAVSTGNIRAGNNDLELIRDGSSDQIVGIRFNNVTIPQNAIIAQSYIEFETDETNSEATNLTLFAEAADNPVEFSWCNGCFGISGRPETSASVVWNNIPAWNSLDERHQTPNLASLIQEVVNRPGWSPGNSMVFIISGSGKRVAESFNGEPDSAPLLHIEYQP